VLTDCGATGRGPAWALPAETKDVDFAVVIRTTQVRSLAVPLPCARAMRADARSGRSRTPAAQEFSIHYGSVEWTVERRFAELRAELGATATMRDIKTLIMRCASRRFAVRAALAERTVRLRCLCATMAPSLPELDSG
jgi:hypothetical protein